MKKSGDLPLILLTFISVLLFIGLMGAIYFINQFSNKADEKTTQAASVEGTAQALGTQSAQRWVQLSEEMNARATSEVAANLLSSQVQEQQRKLEENAHAVATAEAVAQEMTSYATAVAEEMSSYASEGICAYLQAFSSPSPIFLDIEEPPVRSNEQIVFVSYDIPLREGTGWRVGDPEGTPASIKDILAVLCNVDSLTIQFEGDVQIFLDNVNLDGVISDLFPDCTDGGWMSGGNKQLAGCNSVIGNPPGSISNGGVEAIFYAPMKYLGDLSTTYGGSLSFDLAVGYGEALPKAGNVVLTPSERPVTQ